MKRIFSVLLLPAILIISLLTLVSMQKSAWEHILTKDGVEVSSIKELSEKDGVEREFIILRVHNTTNQAVEVSWYLKNWYNDVCRSCDLDQPNEYNKKLILAPGQTITGFGPDGPDELRIFHSFPGKPKVSALTKFELAGFSVRIN